MRMRGGSGVEADGSPQQQPRREDDESEQGSEPRLAITPGAENREEEDEFPREDREHPGELAGRGMAVGGRTNERGIIGITDVRERHVQCSEKPEDGEKDYSTA